MKDWKARTALIVEHPVLNSAAVGVVVDNAITTLEAAGFVVVAAETHAYEETTESDAEAVEA
jgi:hypothetical protein